MEKILLSIAVIIVSGIGAQWLAWRLHFPAIMLLLICGFLAGPVTGLVNPDFLKSDLLYAIVSISASIILFEGSLRLKISELKDSGKIIARLMTVGTLITWILTGYAAFWLFKLPVELAVLLGAILIVTGPTVVQPMLRYIHPTGQLGPVLKWEGIVIDSLGALAAVMVYEFILAEGLKKALWLVAVGVAKTLVMGTLFGILAAALVVLSIHRYIIPEFLKNAFVLTTVVASFVLSSLLYNEPAGFLTVTVFGIALANQNFISIKDLSRFKEDLRTLLLPGLFIILAARIPIDDFKLIDIKAVSFLAFLILLVRPLAVLAATTGCGLNKQERFFIASLAPRGVVAATVSAIFAARLGQNGYPQAHLLVVITFFVIVGTVFIYGVFAPVMAKILKVSLPARKGVLILGAHDWACRIALTLKELGIPVQMADSNWENVLFARQEGLPVVQGNFLNEETFESIDFSLLGAAMAMTPNNEANALALMQLAEEFEKSNLFQLADSNRSFQGIQPFRGRILFGPGMDFNALQTAFDRGGKVVTLPLQQGADPSKGMEGIVPLFVFDPSSKSLLTISVGTPITAKAGHLIIAIKR